MSKEYLLLRQSSPRPSPVIQPGLGGFDPDDSGGAVSRSCPPEQVIPPVPTKWFWRGDFGGVTLGVDPSTVPLVPGGNTTPQNMVMSFLLPFYSRQWQDTILTENAWRNYSHIHLDRYNADQAGLSPSQFVDFMEYIQSWGFYTSYWGIGTKDGNFNSWNDASSLFLPTLNVLASKPASVRENTILIVGEELNSCTSPDGLLDIVSNLVTIAGVDLALHFTSRYPSWQVSGQTPIQFWQEMSGLGVKGLMYQAIPSDPAGTMMAAMWDARKIVAGGDTSLKFVAFELCANEQLYGRRSEIDGCRLGLEATWATRTPGSNVPPVSGYGNGGRLINGNSL